MTQENRGRRFLSIIGIVLLMLCMVTNVYAEGQYVFDNAGVFSAEEIQKLTQKAADLESVTNIKVVLFVEKTFPNEDADSFVAEKFKQHQMKNNGVVIALSTEGEQFIVYSPLFDVLMDESIPLLNASISEGLITLQDKIIQNLQGPWQIEGVSTDGQHIATVNKTPIKVIYEEKPISPFWYVSLIFVIVSSVIIVCSQRSYYKKEIEESVVRREKRLNTSWEEKQKVQNEEFSTVLNAKRKELEAQGKRLQEVTQELQLAQEEIRKYEANFEVISMIHPRIVIEIEEYYRQKQDVADKEVAKQFDLEYKSIMQETVTRELSARIRNLLNQYESLNAEQRKWVTANLGFLKQKLAKCEELQRNYEKEREKINCQNRVKQMKADFKKLEAAAPNMSLKDCYERTQALMQRYQALPRMSKEMLEGEFVHQLQQFWRRIGDKWNEECRRQREEQELEEVARRELERQAKLEEEREKEERKRKQAERLRNQSFSTRSSFNSSRSSQGMNRTQSSFKPSSRTASKARSFSNNSFGGGKSRGGGGGRKF